MNAADVPTEIREGRYALLELIGVGGMASVFRARDRDLQVDRAIKMLRPEDSDRASFQRRLRAEAHAMARVQHPHILAIHDVGNEGDYFYVVMPLAPGGSLSERLEREGALPAGEAVRLTLEVLSGLSAAHAAGVVHRDVKPQNVLLDGRGHALLADFGIALDAHGQSSRHTRSGVAMGSPSYMPPEQRVDARSVDHRADLYAVGAMLFELVSNDNPADLYTAEPDSPRWASVPQELVAVLRKATAMRASERYRSAEDFAEALLEVAASTSWLSMLESPTGARSALSPSASLHGAANTFGFGDTTHGSGESSGRLALATVLSGLVLFGIGAMALVGAVGVVLYGGPSAVTELAAAPAQVEPSDVKVEGRIEVEPSRARADEGPDGDASTKLVAAQSTPVSAASAQSAQSAQSAPTAESAPPDEPVQVPAAKSAASKSIAQGSAGSARAPKAASTERPTTESEEVAGASSAAGQAVDAAVQDAVAESAETSSLEAQDSGRDVPLGVWSQAGGGFQLEVSGTHDNVRGSLGEKGAGRRARREILGTWDPQAGSLTLADERGVEGGGVLRLTLSTDGRRLTGTFRPYDGATRLVSFASGS